MAPEILAHDKAESIDLKAADVYAFGVLLWTLCTRQQAFKGLGDHAISQLVTQGRRPNMFLMMVFPSSIKALIVDCWNQLPNQRPTTTAIVTRLKEINGALSGGADLVCPRDISSECRQSSVNMGNTLTLGNSTKVEIAALRLMCVCVRWMHATQAY